MSFLCSLFSPPRRLPRYSRQYPIVHYVRLSSEIVRTNRLRSGGFRETSLNLSFFPLFSSNARRWFRHELKLSLPVAVQVTVIRRTNQLRSYDSPTSPLLDRPVLPRLRPDLHPHVWQLDQERQGVIPDGFQFDFERESVRKGNDRLEFSAGPLVRRREGERPEWDQKEICRYSTGKGSLGKWQ